MTMGILLSILFGLSVMFAVIAMFYTLIVRNWQSFFVLGIVTFPISLYFYSGEPPIQFLWPISLLCFSIAVLIYWRKKFNLG